jgi:N-acetylmuramic acid 6-phosphate etherase
VVLNVISTIAMIRVGKTFGNLMVDMRATNAKLRDRARRIVADATGVSPPDAALALDDAGGDVKVAIVMLLTGVGATDAAERLQAHGGVVRAALEHR